MTSTVAGFIFGLGAAFFFAFWVILLQRGLEKGGTIRLVVFIMGTALVTICIPIALVQQYSGTLPPVTGGSALNFILTGLLTAGIGPVFIAQSAMRIGAAGVASVRLLDPFFAFLFAALFLGERLSARTLTGILLIVGALGLLQMDRRQGELPDAGQQRLTGIAIGVVASLCYSLSTIFRKAGLLLTPSTVVAGAGEGLAGLIYVLPLLALGREWGTVRAAFSRRHLDLWWSGIAAVGGSLCFNLALERVAVPIAVSLRNTTPWFALFLVPLLLGRRQRPGRWTWMSTAVLTAGMLLIVLR